MKLMPLMVICVGSLIWQPTLGAAEGSSPKTVAPAGDTSKEAELQNIIAQEEAGTLDDDARQARVRDFENRSKTGFDGSVWTPHTSKEGGNDTIAYGHRS